MIHAISGRNSIHNKTPPTLFLQLFDEEKTCYALTGYRPLKDGQNPLEFEVIGK